jgi:SHS2 domain-containing protein
MEPEGNMPSESLTPPPQIAFEEIEHTADRALIINGRNLEELLVNAARGLNSLLEADGDLNSTPLTKSVDLKAMDAESLLVDWLSELAYWAEAEMLVFSKFDFLDVSPTRVTAKIRGRRFTQLENHIKAVTYHNLEIAKTKTGLTATVVFDV